MSQQVIIFDTPLRNGKQALQASLSVKEKLHVAQALERMDVDVMEVGFPVSSPRVTVNPYKPLPARSKTAASAAWRAASIAILMPRPKRRAWRRPSASMFSWPPRPCMWNPS